MCYSAEVSATTFGLVTLASGWLWMRNAGIDRALAVILFFIGLMQGLEWILWENLDCGPVNRATSKAVYVYLGLQPIILNLAAWYFRAGWAPGYLWIAAACTVALPLLLWRGFRAQEPCAYLGPTGNLVWAGMPDTTPLGKGIASAYYLATFYPMLTLKDTTFSILYSFFAILSLGIFGANAKSWPSLWCHFVNALAIFAVVRPNP